MRRPLLLAVLGSLLVLGAIGHSFGVARFYVTEGVPDANRVLLDVWVGESQVLAGALYLAAFRAARAGERWRALAVFGALTVIGWTAPFVPVFFVRAPRGFRIAPSVYLAASLWILVKAAQSKRQVREES